MALISADEFDATVDRFLAHLNKRIAVAERTMLNSRGELSIAAKWRYEELVEVRSDFLKMFDPQPDDTPIGKE